MYYPSSGNKGADQLRGYREADLRLCFRICKNPFFFTTRLIFSSVKVTERPPPGKELFVLFAVGEARWFSGRASDSGARGRGFDPHSGHRVVSLSKIHLHPKRTGNTQ